MKKKLFGVVSILLSCLIFIGEISFRNANFVASSNENDIAYAELVFADGTIETLTIRTNGVDNAVIMSTETFTKTVKEDDIIEEEIVDDTEPVELFIGPVFDDTFSDIITTTKATTTSSEVVTTTTTVATTAVTTTTKEEQKSPDNENIVKAEEDYFWYYPESGRVHTKDCIYSGDVMEKVYGDYIEEARPCKLCNPDIEIGTLYEPQEVIIEYGYAENTSSTYSASYSGTCVSEMTYYSGPSGCYGAAGRTLINNYSVACNSIPLGTIVYIQSSDGSIDGEYRVDDRGGMGDHVIDIFFSDYSYVPYSFAVGGRISCDVWIIE